MVPVLAAIMMMAAPAPVQADSVTGCLSKGTTAGTYAIKTKDGKSMDVMSKTLKLEGHIGHTVTLSGSAMKGGAMEATKMTMVSASCM